MKRRSGGEPLATLYPIWPVWGLNLTSSAPETNVLPLDQLADTLFNPYSKRCKIDLNPAAGWNEKICRIFNFFVLNVFQEVWYIC